MKALIKIFPRHIPPRFQLQLRIFQMNELIGGAEFITI